MIINAVFQVFRSENKGGYQNVDGRLIRKLSVGDQLVVVKKFDINFHINNCDKNGCLLVDKNTEWNYVNVKNILSYGKSWKSLEEGMSARIECQCDKEIVEDDVIYKII